MRIYRIESNGLVRDNGIEITSAEQQSMMEAMYGEGNFVVSNADVSEVVDSRFQARYHVVGGNIVERETVAGIPGAYADESVIVAWDRIGPTNGFDYLYARKQIMIAAATTGWANLTDAEKLIAARWYVVERNERLSIVASFADDVENAANLLQRGRACRQTRSDAASAEIYARLTYAQAVSIPMIPGFVQAMSNYVDYGIEGTEIGDPEGIYDFINSTAGKTWKADGPTPGLSSQAWTPYGMSLANLCARLISILKDGI